MASQQRPELRLYNTLTREKSVFTPIDPANVRMYVCGPTVYDYAHIGNARPVIVFDVLYRLLRHLYAGEGAAPDGTCVTYVRNITDVDDKINARAARDYPGIPLNEAIRKVTEKTAAQFEKDAAALGCLRPTIEPRATDNIEEMVRLVQVLIDAGNAYVASGGEGLEVLFDVASMPDYGRLSRRPLEEQQAGARVAVDVHKRNAGDFVLWKQSDASLPGWPASFRLANGEIVAINGRPGWHIECSAMSDKYLWELVKDRLGEGRAHPHVFDIHAGGLDLIFPHHENEIAQSRSAFHTPAMANVWMHNGFLQVEGQKMSKSLGNFVTIHELLETEKFGGRRWPGEVLRLAMLMTHYREPIDFSVARLEEAEQSIRHWAKIRKRYSDRNWIELNDALSTPNAADTVLTVLCDDLNTVAAVQVLNGMARVAEGALNSSELDNLYVGLRFLVAVEWLGIDLGPEAAALSAPELEHAIVNDAIARRLSLLNEKNFLEADRIRAELLEQGIQLMDYKDAETGERKTRWEVKR